MEDLMSQHANADTPGAASTAVEHSPWVDSPEYPHRIENHVKVYLHLEEAATRSVIASPDTAPAGTRVYRRTGSRGVQYGTVTGWTTEGSVVFVSFDQAGTYAGPTFDALWIDERKPGSTGPRWAVSPASVDGYPLDGVEDGHYCDYEGHPPGARPDWDRQHRDAASVHLPTAEELLPLLATALGSRVEGPSVEQRRTASDLIAEHTEWRSARADLSAGEATGDFPDWHDSDDAGCDLADRAIALLVELTNQPGSTGQPAALDSPGSAAALQRSMLHASTDPGTSSPQRGSEPPASTPSAGPRL